MSLLLGRSSSSKLESLQPRSSSKFLYRAAEKSSERPFGSEFLSLRDTFRQFFVLWRWLQPFFLSGLLSQPSSESLPSESEGSLYSFDLDFPPGDFLLPSFLLGKPLSASVLVDVGSLVAGVSEISFTTGN